MNKENPAIQIANLIPRLISGIKSNYLVSSEITTAQLIILTNLEAEPEVTLKKLSHKIGVTPATTSVMIDKLVKTGQVKRKQDTNDRRKIKLDLTSKGKHKLSRFKKEIESFWSRMLNKTLSLKEQETYLNIIKKIVQELENE